MVLLGFLTAVACYFDYSRRRIPNVLLAMLLSVGLVRAGGAGGWQELLYFLLKMMIVILVFYPVFRVGALGAGDVKLFGIAAAFFESGLIAPFLFITLCFAALISIWKMLYHGILRERFEYLAAYAKDALITRRISGYRMSNRRTKEATVALAGPVLCSILLHMGGIY